MKNEYINAQHLLAVTTFEMKSMIIDCASPPMNHVADGFIVLVVQMQMRSISFWMVVFFLNTVVPWPSGKRRT